MEAVAPGGGSDQQRQSADRGVIAGVEVSCGLNVCSNGEEEGQRIGEDDADQEDVDQEDVDQEDVDRYAKSFYEIYDDHGDTQDCPRELRRFIRREHMDVKIKIKCSSPRNLGKRDVQSVIGEVFAGGEAVEEVPDGAADQAALSGEEAGQADAETYYLSSNFKKFNYPNRNVLWPNPLVYNHRLQPFLLERKKDEDDTTFDRNKKIIEMNKRRLQNLWCYSSSYGVEWNTLDALFLNFKKEKEEHLSKWEENKNGIMLYASRVAKRKLIKSRRELLDKLGIDYSSNVYASYEDTGELHEAYMEDDQEVEYNLLFPRSVFRKWTRTLYFYWKDRYMHYYEDTLCDYLKGEVVDLQLLREQNERNLHLPGKKMMREHSFSLRPVKGSNLYVTRYVPKGRRRVRTDADQFDLTGVGENIYNTVQKEK